MDAAKRYIISCLKRDILPLQGLKSLPTDNNIRLGFHSIESAFPNATFPIGCTHEFLTGTQQDNAATNGFVTFILSRLMQFYGAAIWISTARTIFPSALKTFGVQPEQIIFIDLKNDKEVLYATEEALKCNRITSVISEIKNISFKESRRLQLAAEQSRVTGLLLRHQSSMANTIACVSRWLITSLPSKLEEGMPGVGFPRWNVELLKVRNGKPGTWQIEYSSNHLKEISQKIFSIPVQETRKTG